MLHKIKVKKIKPPFLTSSGVLLFKENGIIFNFQ